MLSAASLRFLTLHRAQLIGIVLFFAFTAVAARVTIPLPFTPVPITLQVMVVLLAGLVLGARAGAASQLVYLAAIAAGLPLDANALGPTAMSGPTAGYLIGFVPAAFITGWLAEKGSATRATCFLAAIAGAAIIYITGVAWLAPAVGGLRAAWTLGVAPFILVDLGKAVVAAAVAESGRLLFSQGPPY